MPVYSNYRICDDCSVVNALSAEKCSNCFTVFEKIPSNSSPVYRMKTKEEVNPEMINICPHCCNKHTLDWKLSSYGANAKYVCSNCQMQVDKLSKIPAEQWGSKYTVKNREEVNPEMVKVCPHCYNPYTLKWSLSGYGDNAKHVCSNCQLKVDNFLMVRKSQL
jgi:hypothetical protein